ncbi:type VII secretion-associated protein [Nocardia panacis]|uniref:Type VII secretion-associated protein n=1 Tax=Nocardia panacis TaxID=2340916 RepID=A0A3A4K2L2_9NOCA|nr:type VII secretion-associated protein [Nocardia panacis]RJO72134.1 type VII secretion-associated protein [Nocardia panacis]
MSVVELVLTDTRVWARGSATHWDTAPSIALGSNGFDLVVGEPLARGNQVSSAVQFVDADRIALAPRLPTAAEGLSAVFATVLQTMRVAVPAERILVVCPTEWGPRRRGLVQSALRQFAADMVFQDLAFRIVESDAATSHCRRIAVFEFGQLATTASIVLRDYRGTILESCEHEPNLAPTELSPATLGPFFDSLLAGQPVDLVQVFGPVDPIRFEILRTVVHQGCGPTVEVRSCTGPDLLRHTVYEAESPLNPVAPTLPAAEWMQPLRARAAAMKPPNPWRPYYIAGGAVAVVIAVAVAAVVLLTGSKQDTPTAAILPTTLLASPPPASTLPTPTTTESTPTTETFGRLQFTTPAGWRLAPGTDPAKTRVDLVPEDGARLRITVVQTPITPGTGYEQVAAKLESLKSQRPPGVITDLQRDQVFGGRSGIAYQEHPTDGSIVRWHVLVEYSFQVSVGCQYLSDNWAMLSGTCERFASSVRVLP